MCYFFFSKLIVRYLAAILKKEPLFRGSVSFPFVPSPVLSRSGQYEYFSANCCEAPLEKETYYIRSQNNANTDNGLCYILCIDGCFNSTFWQYSPVSLAYQYGCCSKAAFHQAAIKQRQTIALFLSFI